MERNSFVFYRSYYEAIRELETEDQINLYNTIFNYAFYGRTPQQKDIAFTLIKPQIDKSYERYEKVCERNKENGKRGGRPKKEKTQENPKNPVGFSETQENPKKPKKPYNYNENDNYNYNENDNESDNKTVLTLGTYNNVLLTEEELTALKSEYPVIWEQTLNRLSVYMKTSGRTYESHYAKIREFIEQDQKKPKETKSKSQDYEQRQYTDEEYLAMERKKLGLA